MAHGAASSLKYGATVFCALIGACATVPQGKFGVSSIDVDGVKHFDDGALLACLATQKRARFGFSLGPSPEPECGTPPFDADRVPVELWTWPWTEWPIFEQASFERDLNRIERWYQARGFYQTEVSRYRVVRNASDREIDIELTIAEGEPIIVTEIDLVGIEGLALEVRRQARDSVGLQEGGRFDEATYEASKKTLASALAEASYARASVRGRVLVDPDKRVATVTFEVTPGPSCRFGKVRVEGNRGLPKKPIVGAAALRPGSSYSVSSLKEAQDAIYGIGAFASVEIVPQPRANSDFVDVLVRVVPARRFRSAIGAGIEAGTREGLQEDLTENLARWDVHLLARVEHRNFLGSMRRLRIEERPRLIFGKSFPRTGDKPRPGNLLMMEIKQPALLERRTILTIAGEWDYGPDPYGDVYYRHDLDTWVGANRYFFGRALYLSSAIHLNLFALNSNDIETCTKGTLQDYHVTFFEHSVRLDQRDSVRDTTRGWLLGLSFQHAGYFLPSDWNYLRFSPEARGYLTLPWHVVLAARVRLGVLAVTSSQITSDENLRDYGPYRYRLRGGGPNSVRGFDPNFLGDVPGEENCLTTGGLRQWESSVELRIPVTMDFRTVLFVDAGDVNSKNGFRLNYPQTTLGFGLRYNTIVGPLRFDVGFLPDGLQVFGTDKRPHPNLQKGRLFGLNGAWHLSIGEAF